MSRDHGKAIAAALLALTLAGCGAGGRAPAPGPVTYYAPAPLEYDLQPMVNTLAETAYNVRAVPYAAWKEHSDTVARNNTYGYRPAAPQICGPMPGTPAMIVCH